MLNPVIGNSLLMFIAVVLAGSGLSILYNYGKDFASVIGGFALIGIAVSVVYKIMNNG